MEAVRDTLDAARRSLEQTSAQEASDEDIQALAEQLISAVSGHVQSGIEQLQRESAIRVQAAIAETKRQRHEVAALSARLEEAQIQLQALRDEGAAGRGRETAAAREAEQLRAKVTALSDRLNHLRTQADGFRLELEAERKQSAERVLEIGQYRAASVRLEEARAELQALRKQREATRGQQTAAIEQVEQRRAEMAELSDRLSQACMDGEGLRLELENERKHSAALLLEVEQCRADSVRLEETRAALQALRDERARGHGQEAATAETEQLGAQAVELTERLNEVSTEAARLRVELETERRQAASMILEVGRARLAAERAETARQAMAAEVEAVRQRQLALAESAEEPAGHLVSEPPATPAAADSLARLESSRRQDAEPETPDDSAPMGSFRRRLAAIVRG